MFQIFDLVFEAVCIFDGHHHVSVHAALFVSLFKLFCGVGNAVFISGPDSSLCVNRHPGQKVSHRSSPRTNEAHFLEIWPSKILRAVINLPPFAEDEDFIEEIVKPVASLVERGDDRLLLFSSGFTELPTEIQGRACIKSPGRVIPALDRCLFMSNSE
jgi:hypothetical protein